MTIKNREQIIEQLIEMLIRFDRECNTYQTDIYLYYDHENHTAELDTFVNVGGNSWLNDDHYTIYTDREHHDDGIFSWVQEISEFADLLEIPAERLERETRVYNYYNAEDDEPLEYCDYQRYISSNGDYMEKLTEAYNDSLEEFRPEYAEKANYIIDCFETEN